MLLEVYCSHLNKDIYFMVKFKPSFSVSACDIKTKEPLIQVTIPVINGRENCGYVDMKNYPWLYDFLSRCGVAGPTYRCLISNGFAYEEFKFFVDRMEGGPLTGQTAPLVNQERKINIAPSPAPSSPKRESRTTKYHMKAVGVTFGDRQRVISRLRVGQPLRFVPEPTNAYDNYAVKIETLSGEQVGYISKDHNQDVFNNIRNGKAKYDPVVSSITGGGFDTMYGVNIEVTMTELL